MRRRITVLLSFIFIILITFIIASNYTCLRRMSVAHGYSKGNGLSLTFSISSFFAIPNNNVQQYTLTKSAIESLGELDSIEFIPAAKKSCKNNIILKGKLEKAQGKNIIHIDQYIFLKNIKAMYLFYHTNLKNNNRIIQLSLSNTNGSLISSSANLTDEKKGSILRTSENYFWDIDYEKYDKLILNIKVYTAANKFLYEYSQPLY